MQGVKRKLVYVTAYEIIGMAISALGQIGRAHV